MEVVVTGHNFESILPKDHPCHVCFKLVDWFQRRRLLNNFPVGSYAKTISADSGHFEHNFGSWSSMTCLLYWLTGFRGDFKTYFPIGSYVKTTSAEGGHLGWRSGVTGHNFESWPPKDHSCFLNCEGQYLKWTCFTAKTVLVILWFFWWFFTANVMS
jgi:hypothetical protein